MRLNIDIPIYRSSIRIYLSIEYPSLPDIPIYINIDIIDVSYLIRPIIYIYISEISSIESIDYPSQKYLSIYR